MPSLAALSSPRQAPPGLPYNLWKCFRISGDGASKGPTAPTQIHPAAGTPAMGYDPWPEPLFLFQLKAPSQRNIPS